MQFDLSIHVKRGYENAGIVFYDYKINLACLGYDFKALLNMI